MAQRKLPTYFDNPVINIKGLNRDDLEDAMKLAFRLTGNSTCEGYIINKYKGIVLLWTESDCDDAVMTHKPLNAVQTTKLVWELLKMVDSGDFQLDDWDRDLSLEDGDLDTNRGWRLYTERWGIINKDNDGYGNSYDGSFLAVIPSFLWYSK